MAKTLIAIGFFVAIAYGVSVWASKSGTAKNSKLLARPVQPRPGDEFRTGLTTDNVIPDPTDAEAFAGTLSGGRKLQLNPDLMNIIGPPGNWTSGNDPAYGTVNGGAQINKGAMPMDDEGIIPYNYREILA